ncbi:uncharacterized protein LOC143038052 isoform X3 [Oratosquilla oratoria]|uniref:uncharacterized protein LOC143038052 isoform X3 n=1 Tax=Oratosquilla oratoria TaxID=337810 RepID=UPI003F76E888
MPPKGVSKAVNKKCPECRKLVPVATKHCHCGHQFFEERRRSTASNASEQDDMDDSPLKELKDMKPTRGGASGKLSIDAASPALEVKRRSERVKREKPNFYDALEYDNQMRKVGRARKERQKEEPGPIKRERRERRVKPASDQDDEEYDEPVKEKKKKKKKKNAGNGEKKDEDIEEDIMSNIPPEKELQFSIILSDINFKMGLNNPKFIKI